MLHSTGNPLKLYILDKSKARKCLLVSFLCHSSAVSMETNCTSILLNTLFTVISLQQASV